MKPEHIADVLLDAEEDFDPKDFVMSRPMNYILRWQGHGIGTGQLFDMYWTYGGWQDSKFNVVRFTSKDQAWDWLRKHWGPEDYWTKQGLSIEQVIG